MLVATIMHEDVITATPDMSLAQAQRLMQEKHLRHLPVLSGKHLVGIVTDRDIRNAVPSLATTLSRGEIAYQLDTTPVKTCMTEQVISITPDTDVVEGAALLLQHTIGGLPVVKDGKLVGMVTEIDFLQAFLSTTPTI